ncbi:MAG: hypothetical protein FD143_1290 [Ignavibacteria bacterium]|nr:MAG: hypothetical protein FD143_1290 [Ignavibacteria bacterium]KAF0160807.1 MAG: hypothetical protein FD188_1412 [Ignavibacteria bacterium]
MLAQVTEKSTKSQILQAYDEALAKLKEQKHEDRKSEKKKEEEQKIVKQASGNSLEKIVNSVGRTKIEIINALDEVGDNLSSEFKKLEEIKSAIEIEQKYLEDIYEIKIVADTLSAMFLAQKEKDANFKTEMENKKTSFEEELLQKKLQWKLEQDNYENSKKERDTLLKKERQREEDEYSYNIQLKRKKDSDTYSEQKEFLEKELVDKRGAVEKELTEREKIVASKEKEFAELKAKVENFSKELENAVKETEKSVIEKIELKFRHQSELSQKEMEGERNLHKQLVQSLENKIKEQTEQIKQLMLKVNESGQQVQTIALKAIESTAGGVSLQRAFAAGAEKNTEHK